MVGGGSAFWIQFNEELIEKSASQGRKQHRDAHFDPLPSEMPHSPVASTMLNLTDSCSDVVLALNFRNLIPIRLQSFSSPLPPPPQPTRIYKLGDRQCGR